MKITKCFKSDHSVIVTEIKCTKSEDYNILWISDLHSDSVHSQFEFINSVVKKYPDTLIVVGGDHLDVMQNFNDKRASKRGLKEEFKSDDYINKIVDWNVELWGKYADRIIAFFVGNHEMVQVKFHGVDLTKMIVKELNYKHGTNIQIGDLAGWIKLRFNVFGRYFTKNIYYSHYPKAGGTRSKGMLSVDLIKGEYPDADLFVSEHIHNTWIKPESVERLGVDAKLIYKLIWIVQMPTLKDEFSGIKRGYVHKNKFGATPIALLVLNFGYSRENGVEIETPRYEFYKRKKTTKKQLQ